MRTGTRLGIYWMQLVISNTQLLALVKCIFSLSHGHSYPERGFSITKILVDAHGTTIDNDTIIALRFVKDHLPKLMEQEILNSLQN